MSECFLCMPGEPLIRRLDVRRTSRKSNVRNIIPIRLQSEDNLFSYILTITQLASPDLLPATPTSCHTLRSHPGGHQLVQETPSHTLFPSLVPPIIGTFLESPIIERRQHHSR